MSFINWGNESPEQLAIRRRLEEQALYEQAVRVRLSQSGQSGGVGGGRAPSSGSEPLPPVIDPTQNSFVDIDYVENYFE